MMKKMYETDYGEFFEDMDEAIQSVMDNMTLDELFDALEDRISFHTLLEWAWKQPNFYDDFEYNIGDAEYYSAAAQVREVTCEDEDEDEDEDKEE